MNSLLHSKRFKKNLLKWLLMYGSALCMLTIVVTYSKYISTYTSNPDTARVAKFDVKMDYSCASDDCKVINSRPVPQLEYYFKIENNSDVPTLIVTNIKVNEDFTFARLEKVQAEDNDIKYSLTNNEIKLETISSNSTNTYKIILNYNKYNDGEYYKSPHDYDTNKLLTIGYSATNVEPTNVELTK